MQWKSFRYNVVDGKRVWNQFENNGEIETKYEVKEYQMCTPHTASENETKDENKNQRIYSKSNPNESICYT